MWFYTSQNTLDENKYISTIAMDLSRAFDCILHVPKLHAYGVSPKSLPIISDYL